MISKASRQKWLFLLQRKCNTVSFGQHFHTLLLPRRCRWGVHLHEQGHRWQQRQKWERCKKLTLYFAPGKKLPKMWLFFLVSLCDVSVTSQRDNIFKEWRVWAKIGAGKRGERKGFTHLWGICWQHRNTYCKQLNMGPFKKCLCRRTFKAPLTCVLKSIHWVEHHIIKWFKG